MRSRSDLLYVAVGRFEFGLEVDVRGVSLLGHACLGRGVDVLVRFFSSHSHILLLNSLSKAYWIRCFTLGLVGYRAEMTCLDYPVDYERRDPLIECTIPRPARGNQFHEPLSPRRSRRVSVPSGSYFLEGRCGPPFPTT